MSARKGTEKGQKTGKHYLGMQSREGFPCKRISKTGKQIEGLHTTEGLLEEASFTEFIYAGLHGRCIEESCRKVRSKFRGAWWHGAQA